MIQVFSSGGGTQSICISALIIQGRLPKPDFAVIADTGREMPTTWTYLDEVVRPAFKSIGLEVHRISREEFACPWGKQIFATSGDLMLPAFTTQNGKAAKLSGFCSGAWKAEVIDRWFSIKHNITRSQYCKWIGFSCDEVRRVLRMQRGREFKNGLIRLPLVELFIRRHEAIKAVIDMGWPKPPRSRCWMCPNQNDDEWFEVQQDYPELFQEAVQLDEWIRQRDPHAYLHSTCKPLKDADLSQRDQVFSGGCPSGECFL